MPTTTPFPSRPHCICGCAYRCHTYRSNSGCAFCSCPRFRIADPVEAVEGTGYIEARDIRAGMFILAYNVNHGAQRWAFVRHASQWNGGPDMQCYAFSLQYTTDRNMVVLLEDQPVLIAQMEVDPLRPLR